MPLCGQRIKQNIGVLAERALKGYNRYWAYLSDVANREKVPVFSSISEALDCVVQK